MTVKKKTVFDAGVVLQATLNPRGPAGQSLLLMETDRITTYLSPHTRDEIADVLTRPVIRRKYPRFTDQRVEAMLARLDAKATMVSSVFRYMQYPRDPNDEPVINLAIHVKADYIVARDKDLLDLNKSRDFRLLYPFLRIVDPVTFLQEITRSQDSEEQKADTTLQKTEADTKEPPHG